MQWTKHGRIFVPDGERAWMRTHAALPVPLSMSGDTYRVYISGRSEENRAQIGYFDFDLSNPSEAIRISDEPVIRMGAIGAHDECGATGACVVWHANQLYQYYTGWTLSQTVPFVFHIGLAISDDQGKTFSKVSDGPVLGRSTVDPYLVASPSVLLDSGTWRMWYVSGDRWESTAEGPKHYYHIRYAESEDGIDWRPSGRVCVDFEGDEYAFARPAVSKTERGYRMWYCVRGNAYRIGYAESDDGLAWTRMDDETGIEVSPDGWDSEMLAYPYVFAHGDQEYLLYNGNDYGRTGVGLASRPKLV